ncbi:MAG: BlaI/MecI/CopY family transcriptional regulator [Candidatus Sumerlaeaceae bacterium]|nr:BlaI/MecI/CopY family transcriptional regulator [Candidatus Sumerlaeaceae bacterium]
MTPTPKVKPTNSELEILRVLWDRGASTVGQVHEVLAAKRDMGYTTVLKMLQIMMEKGLVSRDDSRRQHIYTAAAGEQSVQRQLMRDLLDKAFAGSAANLVMHALSAKKATQQELQEIREILDRLEGESK